MGKNNTVQPTVGTEQHLRGEIGQYIDAELIFSHQLQTSFFPSPPTRTIPPHPPWAGRKGREANRRAWWEDPRQVRGEYVLITEISLHGRFAKYKSLQSYLLWPILHTAEWSLKFKSNPLTPLLKTFQGLNEIQLLSMASNVPMAPAPLPSLLIVCFSSCFSGDSSTHLLSIHQTSQFLSLFRAFCSCRTPLPGKLLPSDSRIYSFSAFMPLLKYPSSEAYFKECPN